jgi:hypothetical protein
MRFSRGFRIFPKDSIAFSAGFLEVGEIGSARGAVFSQVRALLGGSFCRGRRSVRFSVRQLSVFQEAVVSLYSSRGRVAQRFSFFHVSSDGSRFSGRFFADLCVARPTSQSQKGGISSGNLAIGDYFPPAQQASFGVFLGFENAAMPFSRGLRGFFGRIFSLQNPPVTWHGLPTSPFVLRKATTSGVDARTSSCSTFSRISTFQPSPAFVIGTATVLAMEFSRADREIDTPPRGK